MRPLTDEAGRAIADAGGAAGAGRRSSRKLRAALRADRAVRRARSDAFQRARDPARARQHGCGAGDRACSSPWRASSRRPARCSTSPFAAPLPSDPVEAARAQVRRSAARLEAYTEAARLLLGNELVVLPLFAAHPEGVPELAAATASPVESDPLGDRVLAAVGRPRAGADAGLGHGARRTTTGCATRCSTFVPVQLPARAGEPKWIGGALRRHGRCRRRRVDCDASTRRRASRSPMAGLLVDEWTELVPSPDETTGIAMHINRPNAVAPQALLLAVAPTQTGHWAWTDLVAILQRHDRARAAAGRRAGRHQARRTSSCCRRSSPRSTTRG